MEDLNKFSSEAGKARFLQAEKDISNGCLHYYENASEELKAAKALPKNTSEEKEIRSDAIKNARIKRESASLIKKYGIGNIKVPDNTIKEEIINRETNGFMESLKLKQELRKYLKAESVYMRITKPYTDAKSLITQAENYTHYEELQEKYFSLKTI